MVEQLKPGPNSALPLHAGRFQEEFDDEPVSTGSHRNTSRKIPTEVVPESAATRDPSLGDVLRKRH